MSQDGLIEALKVTPPVATGLFQWATGAALPAIVNLLTALWFIALLVERGYRLWCWWNARREREKTET